MYGYNECNNPSSKPPSGLLLGWLGGSDIIKVDVAKSSIKRQNQKWHQEGMTVPSAGGELSKKTCYFGGAKSN